MPDFPYMYANTTTSHTYFFTQTCMHIQPTQPSQCTYTYTQAHVYTHAHSLIKHTHTGMHVHWCYTFAYTRLLLSIHNSHLHNHHTRTSSLAQINRVLTTGCTAYKPSTNILYRVPRSKLTEYAELSNKRIVTSVSQYWAEHSLEFRHHRAHSLTQRDVGWTLR